VKGLPQKTIDAWGNSVGLINKEFYEKIFNREPVKKEFQTIYKRVFGTIEISSLTMSRKVSPMMEYKVWN